MPGCLFPLHLFHPPPLSPFPLSLTNPEVVWHGAPSLPRRLIEISYDGAGSSESTLLVSHPITSDFFRLTPISSSITAIFSYLHTFRWHVSPSNSRLQHHRGDWAPHGICSSGRLEAISNISRRVLDIPLLFSLSPPGSRLQHAVGIGPLMVVARQPDRMLSYILTPSSRHPFSLFSLMSRI